MSRRTLQYYDDQGLVQPQRSKENYRLYGEDELQRIWRILVYKEIGFQLDQIADLLKLTDSVIEDRLEWQISSIEAEILVLQQRKRLAERVLEGKIPKGMHEARNIDTVTYKEMVRKLAKED